MYQDFKLIIQSNFSFMFNKCPLIKLINECIEIYLIYANLNNIKVIFEIGENVPNFIITDSNRLK